MPRSDRSLRVFLSTMMDDLPPGDLIQADDLLTRIEQRGFAVLMIFCTALAIIPMPGPNAILTIPLIMLTSQMVLGFAKPWFPRWIRQRQIKRTHLQVGIDTLNPILSRLEYFIRPRLVGMIPHKNLRPIGLVALFLALIIALPLPVPGANLLPALCVLMMGLALLNRDGLVLWLAALIGLAMATKIVIGLVWLGGLVAENI